MLADKLTAAAKHAANLQASSDALNASIERFLAGMDAMAANLQKQADEVESLKARILELEAKAAK
jgi:CII-binding regulator of phage lambda lysogenization HflD